MLRLALIFTALAVVAGFFGFVDLTGVPALIVKAVFLLLLALVVATMVVRTLRDDSAT